MPDRTPQGPPTAPDWAEISPDRPDTGQDLLDYLTRDADPQAPAIPSEQAPPARDTSVLCRHEGTPEPPGLSPGPESQSAKAACPTNVASSNAARDAPTLADLARRAHPIPAWVPRAQRAAKMSAPEIARHTALGTLKHLAEAAAAPADLHDVIARLIWRCWPPLQKAFIVANPIGSYLGAGLVVHGTVVQPGLGLAPFTSAPPYRYSPSIETAGSALKLLLSRGMEPDEIAATLGYEGEPALAARLEALPSDADYRAKYPRGRRPPKVKAANTNQGE